MAAVNILKDTGNRDNSLSSLSRTELNLLGEMYFQAEEFDRAEDIARRSLCLDIGNPAPHNLLCMIALQSGHPAVAIECIKTALAIDDTNARYHCNLAIALYCTGAHAEAHAVVRKVLEIAAVADESHGMAYFRLGEILRRMDALQFARPVLERAVLAMPDSPEIFARLAFVLAKLDLRDEALIMADASADRIPIDVESITVLRDTYNLLAQPRKALFWCQKLIELAPANPELYFYLATQLDALGFHEKSEKAARRALLLSPGHAEAQWMLASSLKVQSKWEDAWVVLQTALPQHPGHELLTGLKADMLERRGEVDAAYACLHPLIENLTKFKTQTITVYLTILRRLKKYDRALKIIENTLQNPGLHKATGTALMYEVGRLYNSTQNYDRAFIAYAEANRNSTWIYNREQEEKVFEQKISAFNGHFVAAAPRATNDSNQPIFIVGMPRSGTSLTEKILASHPDVFGAGELIRLPELADQLSGKLAPAGIYDENLDDLTPALLDDIASQYLATLSQLAPPGCKRVVDKMPHNFTHLGLMSLLFPRATFIHCKRDAIDTCLSCFFQEFASAGLSFASDLESLGHYYRLYERMMKHWNSVLPLALYEVHYEQLVSKQHEQTEALLAHCGLDWNDTCLAHHTSKHETRTASYNQVRRSIHQESVQRWKHYEKNLGPLIRALGKRQ